MKKVFPFECCKSCTNTVGKSRDCKNCEDGSKYAELYDADPNCVHKLISPAIGGGLRCKYCNGWICY